MKNNMNQIVSKPVHSLTRGAAILLCSLALFSCNESRPVVEEPAWINDPGEGAVGSAVTHVRGRHAQEELAITRARERLAARMGVELSSVQTVTERVINERAYVTSNKLIDQSVKNREIKAHVRETWYDNSRDVIWVWVYPVE